MSRTDEKNKVLIVDDTPGNLEVLRQMLTDHGYDIQQAVSGEAALKAVKTDLPDLILLDIMMPGMDGYEVCERLKADGRTMAIPIIFISSLTELENKIKSFTAGGVDYITKPFQAEEVIARVETHMALRNLRAKLENKVDELQKALKEIKTLRGMLPICASCKKIRDDKGYWNQIERYVQKHTEAEFTHGICPDCLKELYPEVYEEMKNHLDEPEKNL